MSEAHAMSATDRARFTSSCVAIHVPSVTSAALILTQIKLLLKVRGVGGTFEWIRRRVGAVQLVDGVDFEAVRAAEYRVALAGALYPGRAQCLEQSLTLYYLLRRQGVGVRLRMGVQPHPFAAHAWVELAGAVINDISEHVRHFSALDDPLP